MNNPTPEHRHRVARGAAWAHPAITLGAAAPTAPEGGPVSVPTQNGLQGWVLLSKDCSRSRMELRLDGVGNYPERGLWVLDTAPASELTEVSVTYYFPTGLRLRWRLAGEANAWSLPSRSTSTGAIPGMTAYTTRYTGDWRHVVGEPSYSYAVEQPAFRATTRNLTYCTDGRLTTYSHHSVTVDGQTIASRRGPLGL